MWISGTKISFLNEKAKASFYINIHSVLRWYFQTILDLRSIYNTFPEKKKFFQQEGSGSGVMSGAWVEPSSGMLGDEIMPVSRLDDEVEKRAKIARASKIKTGAKRIWVSQMESTSFSSTSAIFSWKVLQVLLLKDIFWFTLMLKC